MLDKDKLILAIYVNVDKKSESHIECLTPKIVNDKLADEFINEIKRLEKFIKNFDKNEKKQIN